MSWSPASPGLTAKSSKFVRVECVEGPSGLPRTEPRMIFLSYAYRFLSNFIFLALVYYSLNFMDKYHQRAVVAILVLIYGAMRGASALRSFYFFQRIERLEGETRRLSALTGDGPSASAQRKQVISEVSGLRHAGELKAYIDLLFLALVVLLCVSKIVTD